MAFISVFNKPDGDPEEEMRLGQPDGAEAVNLERHVDRCATRYRLFTKRLRVQGRQVNRIEFIMWSLAIYEIATNGPVHEFIKAMLIK